MKKFLVAIGAIAMLTACGGGDEEAPVDETPADEAPADEATSYDADSARATYEASCIGCHGGNLEGGGGPALIGTGLSASEIEDIIHNGVGTMPAQNVEDDEASNLAEWLAAQ
ncbi:c-type cytochrome [Bacillus sp. FJAT-45037]|uniref:c-type cytochrome n=1 Tax=Bacillus sp. FJAT-45037 TaxID=2011007 RepID=UPI000C23B55E|nr:c-type cytochrome [Bacillus sp. FJAT-45037]